MTKEPRQTSDAILQALYVIIPEIDVDPQDSDASLSPQSINEVSNNSNLQQEMVNMLQKIELD